LSGILKLSSLTASKIARSSEEVLDSGLRPLEGIRWAPADKTALKTFGSSASYNTQAAEAVPQVVHHGVFLLDYSASAIGERIHFERTHHIRIQKDVAFRHLSCHPMSLCPCI